MRTAWTSILSIASCAVAASSFAAPPQAPQPQEAQRPSVVAPPQPPQPQEAQRPSLNARQIQEAGRMTPDEAQSLMAIFFPKLPARSIETDKETAGLASTSRPELLTWERVHGLALARFRTGPARLAENLDAKAFAEIADRNGVADFSRFRRDFLASRAGADGTFRDPSGDYLELLRRIQIIDNARCDVARQENALNLFRELIRGESSGLSSLEVDLAESSVVRARERLADETAQFRDGLGELKAALGLTLRTPLVPDRREISGFREAFEAVNDWHRKESRTLNDLHQLTMRIPEIGDVVIGGKPILGAIAADPSRLDDVVAGATRGARENRARSQQNAAASLADVQRELQIARRIRRLVETRRAYESEKRRYELTGRLLDELITQLVAPPAGGTHALAQAARAALGTATLLSQFGQIQRTEDRLVDLWTSFKQDRLALYRELGVLPYNDWKSFLDDLTARAATIK